MEQTNYLELNPFPLALNQAHFSGSPSDIPHVNLNEIIAIMKFILLAMARILLLFLAGVSSAAAFLPVSHHGGIGAAGFRTPAWAGQQYIQSLGGRRSASVRGAGARGLCAQIKFADAVEEVLKRKFKGKEKVPRVLKSWRRCAALPHPRPILGPLFPGSKQQPQRPPPLANKRQA
jgi:hypothetical protein